MVFLFLVRETIPSCYSSTWLFHFLTSILRIEISAVGFRASSSLGYSSLSESRSMKFRTGSIHTLSPDVPHWTSYTSEAISGGVGSCVTATSFGLSLATTSTTPRDVGSYVTSSSFWGSPLAILAADCEDVGSCGETSS